MIGCKIYHVGRMARGGAEYEKTAGSGGVLPAVAGRDAFDGAES